MRLIEFRDRYRRSTLRSADAIGRQLIEHCFEYFVLGKMPRLFLVDPTQDNQRLALHDIYAAEYKPATPPRPFAVQGRKFEIQDVLVPGVVEGGHALKFCAHERAVEASGLAARLPYLHAPLTNDRGAVCTYQGYVTGQVLDERVDAARTGFDIDRRGELPLADGEPESDVDAQVVWDDVLGSAIQAADDFLKLHTTETRRQAYARVQGYIESEPQYRVLLGRKQAALEALPGNLSDPDLDTALHRLLAEVRQEVRDDARNRLQEVDKGTQSLAEHRAAVVKVLGDLNDVAKSDLARYVVDRAAVLSFCQKLLGKDDGGSFAREDALHNLFFPMKRTSNEVDFQGHNLWLLDERLAHHRYLASDLKFSKQNASGSPVQIESEDRPDILVYNRPHVYAPSNGEFASVVIVEFKRPERTDVQGKESPIRQVLRYVQLVRDGRAARADGSTFEPIPSGTPFYCYIVATLTPEMRDEAKLNDFIEAPDRCGYFKYISNYNAYVELSSYRKVLEDAKKRNKAFFDQLQIPPSAL